MGLLAQGGGNADSNWGWGAYLLPFMDQGPLYNQLDVGNTQLEQILDDNTLRSLVQTPYPAFRCPSDVGPALNDKWLLRDSSEANHQTSTSNYVGTNRTIASSRNAPWAPLTTPPNGMFWIHSKVRLRDITDGTSNTVFIGERAYKVGTSQFEAGNVFGTRDDPDDAAVWAEGNRTINSHVDGFSSPHVGGCHFLMGDGAVRFISENINHNTNDAVNSTFEYLIGRNDGNVVGEF